MDEQQDEGTGPDRPALDAARNRVAGYGQVMRGKAVEQLDAGREKASHALEARAERLATRAKEEHGIRRLGAKGAAAGLSTSGRFLEEHSASDLSIVATFIRLHPFMASAGAFLCGFILGRIFSSADS